MQAEAASRLGLTQALDTAPTTPWESRMKALLSVVTAALLMTATHTSHGAKTSAQPVQDPDLASMLIKYSEASTAFYNGHPDAVKALWSHAEDVTLSGAAGGATAKGWNEVSKRLSWASSQFLNAQGSKAVDELQVTLSGDFAYIIQYEHIRYHPPGQAKEGRRDYRVTTIFRRESDGWRVVHRHADTQMARQDIR
jgi:ketosteroid isomerase-like protein